MGVGWVGEKSEKKSEETQRWGGAVLQCKRNASAAYLLHVGLGQRLMAPLWKPTSPSSSSSSAPLSLSTLPLCSLQGMPAWLSLPLCSSQGAPQCPHRLWSQVVQVTCRPLLWGRVSGRSTASTAEQAVLGQMRGASRQGEKGGRSLVAGLLAPLLPVVAPR